MSDRSTTEYVAGIVALFAVVGVGVGLAVNVSLAFLIEWQIDPGGDPTDSTLVGLTLVQSLLFPLMVGPLVAGFASLAAGYAMDRRRLVATLVGGAGSAAGFYVMAVTSLFLTVVVLAQYGGGGGGSDLPRSLLVTAVVEAGVPVGIVGGAAGYLGSRFSD